MAGNLCNIGIIYYDKADYYKALENFTKALTILKLLNDKKDMAVALAYIGNVYSKAPDSLLRKRGIASKNRYVKAIEYQKQSLQLSSQVGNIYSEASTWSDLSDTYEKQKDYAIALKAYKKYTGLKDTMFSQDKMQEITQKEMQYQFDKTQEFVKAETDKRLAISAAGIKQQRTVKNAVIAGAAIIIFSAIAMLSFYKRKRDAEAKKKEAELKAEVADVEMKALRSQMNPHFIFNSLNSINDYIDKHDTATATYYTTKFAKLMRTILEHSEQKEISLADDLGVLELYMQLESLRMNNKFSYNIELDDDIDKENTLVPPLILQPFVENSIWHGIANMKGKGEIKIRIKKEGDMINYIVEDNGIGRAKAEIEKSAGLNEAKKSMGMKITKARINTINKVKKTNANVEMSDLQQGTKVQIKLPLELSF